MAKKQIQPKKHGRPKPDVDQYKKIVGQMLQDVQGLERMQAFQTRLMAEVHRRLKLMDKLL